MHGKRIKRVSINSTRVRSGRERRLIDMKRIDVLHLNTICVKVFCNQNRRSWLIKKLKKAEF